MMVFARYVMFSEVYWHHAVRSATCMIQRAVWELQADWLHQVDAMGEADFIAKLRQSSESMLSRHLSEGLFGLKRELFKRLAEYHRFDNPEIHHLVARRPYAELVDLSERLGAELSKMSGLRIAPMEVLLDAPPIKLEVQFNIQLKQSSGRFLPLGELSPVARTLAGDQFDNLVKRVRVFVHPRLRDALRSIDVASAIDRIAR